jgi:hypothetical protein
MMAQAAPPPGWEDPDRIMASIRYRDRGRPEDDAWPVEVKPDPRAGVRTVARATPPQQGSEISMEIRARLGLVGVDYVERIIAMQTESGMVLAASHSYVPASLDGYLDDGSWRLAEVGRFALPGVKVTLVSKQLHVRLPTRDEAAVFAIPVECALTEIYCAMVIGPPFAVRAGLIVRAPGFTPVQLSDAPLRIREHS